MTRLEGQVTRYKSAAENAEKVEDELKAEKRKLQREVDFSETCCGEVRKCLDSDAFILYAAADL